MSIKYLAVILAVAAAALASPAVAINITYHSPNAACYLDGATVPAWGKWEFDNPLKGNEHIFGHKVLEWRDAGYDPASATPYQDWTVHTQGGTIDGDLNEIWMRDNTPINQWIETGTTVASTIVAVNIAADGNDGLCEVWVDNQQVFAADMGSWPMERVIILVKGLPNTTHWVEVRDLGFGAMGGCDVHCFGAAALAETEVKWEQPPALTETGTIFNGWNEPSYAPGPQAAADDWLCTTSDPVKDIHWWGSHENWKELSRPTPQPDFFRITIWTDVPAGVDARFSHPGTCIWQYDAYGVIPEFEGWDYDPIKKQIETCYRYDLVLTEENWFYQSPQDNIYWLCIQAVYSSGEIQFPWGWKTRPREPSSPAPDAAVRMWVPALPGPGTAWLGGEPLATGEQAWDLAFRLTTSTQETSIKWSQPPVWEGNYIYGWDEKSVYRFPPIVADDWMCQEMTPVSDVHWWGSYLDWMEPAPPQPAPNGFYIGVWTDMPAGTSFSHPDRMLKQWYVPLAQTGEHYVGMDYHPEHGYEACFRYDFDIPEEEWFWQTEPNTIYWLSIAADYGLATPPQFVWGWKTRPHYFQDDAVRMYEPPAPVPGSVWGSGEPIKDKQGASWDTAFQLTTKQIYGMVKWDQPPVLYADAVKFNGWDEKSVYNTDQIVGDDWLCNSRFPVTDVHWWGSFIGWSSEHVPQLPDRFHVNIWDDIPTGITDPWSHPGKCLQHMVVPMNEVSCMFAGWDIDPRDPITTAPEACFRFDVDLRPEQWFYQPRDSDQIFWVTIAAEYETTPAHSFGLKTRPNYFQDDAIKLFDPTAPVQGMIYTDGKPIEFPEGTSWDVAFRLTTIPIGTLRFSKNVNIANHLWSPGSLKRNNMLSLSVGADPIESISWDTVTLQAFGRGNDQTDISSVDVWLDVGVNLGAWDVGDVWIGTGTYPADNGTVTITIANPPPAGAAVIIPAAGSVPALITYTMSSTATAGESYYFKVVDATGTGQTSGQSITQPYWVLGLPIDSARKVMSGLRPISIAEAKKLAPGTGFMMQDRYVTADFESEMNLFYIADRGVSETAVEQSFGICGIGVDTNAVSPGVITLGDKAAIYGECQLLNSSELVVLPDIVSFAPGTALNPLGMNNMWTGADSWSYQPGVSDDGLVKPPAYGLSTVGLLVRAWGQFQGYSTIDIGGGVIAEVGWIYDGSKVKDGFGPGYDGIAVMKPSDWSGEAPAVGSYLGVTGILRAIPSPSGVPVRLLVPRTQAEMQTY